MQPKSKRRMSSKEIAILKRTMANSESVSKGLKENDGFCTELPQIVGIKLTNRCNLRCKTCYEWNEQGYHRNMSKDDQNSEIDIKLLKKVIDETEPAKSNLYLWGGEPLYYSKFYELSCLLEGKNRIIAICTNGQLIRKNMDSLVRMGEYLELLIAVDGLKDENDFIRGKGTYEETLAAIKELLALREKGIFKGKISIHCVISEEMVGKLYDFLIFFEALGVDVVILCYPWYISEKTSHCMDRYYEKYIGMIETKRPSWYAFKYKLPSKYYNEILADKEMIMGRTWGMQVKFQPELRDPEILDFLNDELALKPFKCFSVADRLELLPDGSVSTCKHFPEMIVGNLKEESVYNIWHSDKYCSIRTAIQSELMPVCTKCNNLYLHGKKALNEK